MAAPKNPRNGTTKAIEELEKAGKADLCPPTLSDGIVPAPKKGVSKSLGNILEEQERLYRLLFKGMLAISDYTKMMYGLGQMSSVIKNKAELEALEDAYIKQWQGVRIVAPEGEAIPDHMAQAIEGEIIEGS